MQSMNLINLPITNKKYYQIRRGREGIIKEYIINYQASSHQHQMLHRPVPVAQAHTISHLTPLLTAHAAVVRVLTYKIIIIVHLICLIDINTHGRT